MIICKNKLNIKTFTWTKDSNELFDFENSELIKCNFSLSHETFIIRNNNSIFLNNEQELKILDISKNQVLLKLTCDINSFYVTKNFDYNNNEPAWISLRHFKNESGKPGYSITVGDIFKFGRIKLRVRTIQSDDDTKVFDVSNNLTLDQHNFLRSKQIENNFTSEILKHKRICRICYCDDKEVESPLLNPCNCMGGVKYIHFSCLQQWLKSKCALRSFSNKNCITYTFKLIECEICKTILPDLIMNDSKYYHVWNFIDHKFKNFIILETILSDKSTTRTFFILNFDEKKELKIGRNNDSDLRITDISVSRFHAIIKQKKCEYIIEDNSSKFGSLCMLQHPLLPVIVDNPICLQVGRTMVNFSLLRPWSLCSCFNKKNYLINYSYINRKFIPYDKLLNVKVMNKLTESSDSAMSLDKNYINEEKYDNINNLNCCDELMSKSQLISKKVHMNKLNDYERNLIKRNSPIEELKDEMNL